MSSRDGYRKDTHKYCCEQCRMMQPTCDVCKDRNAALESIKAENERLKANRVCENEDCKKELASLREENELHEIAFEDEKKKFAELNAALASLKAENERLNAERRRDALDGQAALDEANNALAAAGKRLENAKKYLKGCGAVKLTDKQIDELLGGDK